MALVLRKTFEIPSRIIANSQLTSVRSMIKADEVKATAKKKTMLEKTKKETKQNNY